MKKRLKKYNLGPPTMAEIMNITVASSQLLCAMQRKTFDELEANPGSEELRHEEEQIEIQREQERDNALSFYQSYAHKIKVRNQEEPINYARYLN